MNLLLRFIIPFAAAFIEPFIKVTGGSGDYDIQCWNGTAWQTVASPTGQATDGNFTVGQLPIGGSGFVPGNSYDFRVIDHNNSALISNTQTVVIPNANPAPITSVTIGTPSGGTAMLTFENAYDYQKTEMLGQPEPIIEDLAMGHTPHTFTATLNGVSGKTYFITTADVNGNEVMSNQVTFP